MSRKTMAEIEIKEYISKSQLIDLLYKWAQALEDKQDLRITIGNYPFTLPADIYEKAKIRLEYEIEEDEQEFEVTLKW
jgi:amphi-Trp domain-containing protein